MPELLTRRETPKSAAARWPASNRNGGRLQFGMVAGIKSERWPASLGIPGRLPSESAHDITEVR